MKIIFVKECKYWIQGEVLTFRKGDVKDVDEQTANKLIECGWAKNTTVVETVTAIDDEPEKEKQEVFGEEENKMESKVESKEEKKETPKKAKRAKGKKKRKE